jgi:hypothetical protein
MEQSHVSTASQGRPRQRLISQGKKVNLENVGIEPSRHLGQQRKVEWDKEVDETRGGKLAKNILATIPKPKRVSKKDPPDDTRRLYDMNSKTTDPYIKARKEYDEITHNINVSKHNWQANGFCFGVALMISITSNIFTIKKAHIVPYIVQVDNLGRALATSEAKEMPVNDESGS